MGRSGVGHSHTRLNFYPCCRCESSIPRVDSYGSMPAQMKTAVVDALAKVGKMPVEQAEATVTDWQIKGKYNVEVW